MQFQKFGLGLGLALALSVPAIAQPMAPIAGDEKIGDAVIHPFHHASAMLTWNGKHVLIDPAPMNGAPPETDATAEYKAVPAPDVIVVTHGHGDHFSAAIITAVATPKTVIVAPKDVADKIPEALKAQVKVMANGEKATVNGIEIEAVPAYNTTEDRLKFHAKGVNNGYIFSVGGKKIYFAGDTEGAPELQKLSNIDAAFIPMNLPYTETEDEAAAWVKAFKPKVVYPYHYGKSDVAKFKAAVGGASEVRLLKWY